MMGIKQEEPMDENPKIEQLPEPETLLLILRAHENLTRLLLMYGGPRIIIEDREAGHEQR